MRTNLLTLIALTAACSSTHVSTTPDATQFPASAEEPRLANIRQLTRSGENAEAYFSADGKKLIFQHTEPPNTPCDQIFEMKIDGTGVRRLSNGNGRTTCSYFFPAGDRILYSSTHHVGAACPPPPDMSQGYVWALYDYDIYTAKADGSDIRALFRTPGYDAEATISRDGKKIVFTSTRDGDLDLYVMDADGSNVKRLTTEIGYDGGAFFSADGSKIVYRAYHPTEPAAIQDYQRLLKLNLVRPTQLDIYVINADGSNRQQVTNNRAANFAPFFHPNGHQIIFSSNVVNPRGRNFDLYLVNIDGTGLERVTTHEEFDGFPMFSPDGKTLVFASNRGAAKAGDTNIFLADWVDRVAGR
jgi:Tol biopolymer transport system component